MKFAERVELKCSHQKQTNEQQQQKTLNVWGDGCGDQPDKGNSFLVYI